MKLGTLFVTACFLCSNLLYAQNRTKIYYINKIKPDQLFNNPQQYSPNMKLQSAGVEVYRYRNGIKDDSLFTEADGFQCWNDSLSFSIQVSDDFLSKGSTISLNPTFYLKKNKDKGGLPNYLQGKEQPIVQIFLKAKSNPSGAKVYLIPKLYWERDPKLPKFDSQALFPFLVSQGITTVSLPVQEYVYIVVFQYKSKHSIVQIAPNHLQPIDSVFTKFN